MSSLVQYDAAMLQKLGLSETEAEELRQQGISLEEYASMLGEDLSNEVQQVEATAIRYSIVHSAQVWKNEATDETRKTLVGVPVFFHAVRGYFAEGVERPICSSLDGRTGYYVNEDGERVGRECARCPFNAWGSAPNGRGKLCKELRRIYLLEEGHDLPSVISLPPTSLRTWDTFVASAAYEGLPVSGRVVELALEKQSNGGQIWSTLAKPRTVRRLSPTEYVRIRALKEQIEAAARRAAVTASEYMQQTEQAEQTESAEAEAQTA